MEIKYILESLLFSAQRPMSVKELRDVLVSAATAENADEAAKPFKKIKEDDLAAALEELAREHDAAGPQLPAGVRGGRVAVRHAAGIFAVAQGAGRGEEPSAAAVAGGAGNPGHHRLSPAGDAGGGGAGARRERGWHHANAAGTRLGGAKRPRGSGGPSGPLQHHAVFLEYFGLRSLEDLPAAEELRRIPVERPPAPVTAEPGLATVPPEQLQLPTDARGSSDGTLPAAGDPRITGLIH